MSQREKRSGNIIRIRQFSSVAVQCPITIMACALLKQHHTLSAVHSSPHSQLVCCHCQMSVSPVSLSLCQLKCCTLRSKGSQDSGYRIHPQPDAQLGFCLMHVRRISCHVRLVRSAPSQPNSQAAARCIRKAPRSSLITLAASAEAGCVRHTTRKVPMPAKVVRNVRVGAGGSNKTSDMFASCSGR